MLMLKRMSAKKVTIYIFIIILTLGATGLIIYKNLGVGRRGASAPDNLNNWNSGLTASERKIKSNPELDTAIFEKEKFKSLKENNLIYREKSQPGKRDLFKPD